MIELENTGVLDISYLVGKSRPDLVTRWDNLMTYIPETCNIYTDFLCLITFIKQTKFFHIPASARYHLAQPHGLLEHSLNVTETCLSLCESLKLNIPKEYIVIAGLMHDLGKANEGYGRYVPNEPTPNQKKYGYMPKYPYTFERSHTGVYFDHEDYSAITVAKFIPQIPLYVLQAIKCHNGQYVDSNKNYRTQEHPFSLVLHWADCWSGFVIEKI